MNYWLKRNLNHCYILALCLLGLNTVCIAGHGIEHSGQGPIIELSDETRSAIDSGISLTFVSEYAELNTFFLFQWAEVKQRHTYRISRHALSERYLVHIDDELRPAIFRSSAQGVAFISKAIQRQFRTYALDDPKWHLRLTLDKYQLPAPMRLTAFISKNWKFNSGWSQWQFAE